VGSLFSIFGAGIDLTTLFFRWPSRHKKRKKELNVESFLRMEEADNFFSYKNPR